MTVEVGWMILEGIFHGNFQKEVLDNAIDYLKGVIDKIKMKTEMKNEVEKELVEKALKRSWILDIDNIKVKVDGKTISLSGFVDSLFQKEEAERIAWNIPGVSYVDNELFVGLD